MSGQNEPLSLGQLTEFLSSSNGLIKIQLPDGSITLMPSHYVRNLHSAGGQFKVLNMEHGGEAIDLKLLNFPANCSDAVSIGLLARGGGGGGGGKSAAARNDEDLGSPKFSRPNVKVESGSGRRGRGRRPVSGLPPTESLRGTKSAFNCKLCSLKFKYRRLVEIHIRERHLPYKPFMCSKCDYKSIDENDVFSHLTRSHAGDSSAKIKVNEADFDEMVEIESQLIEIVEQTDEELFLQRRGRGRGRWRAAAGSRGAGVSRSIGLESAKEEMDSDDDIPPQFLSNRGGLGSASSGRSRGRAAAAPIVRGRGRARAAHSSPVSSRPEVLSQGRGAFVSRGRGRGTGRGSSGLSPAVSRMQPDASGMAVGGGAGYTVRSAVQKGTVGVSPATPQLGKALFQNAPPSGTGHFGKSNDPRMERMPQKPQLTPVRNVMNDSNLSADPADQSGEMYTCLACGQKEMSLELIENHCLTLHCDLKPYSCTFCEFSAQSVQQVMNHVHSAHKDELGGEQVGEEIIKIDDELAADQAEYIDCLYAPSSEAECLREMADMDDIGGGGIGGSEPDNDDDIGEEDEFDENYEEEEMMYTKHLQMRNTATAGQEKASPAPLSKTVNVGTQPTSTVIKSQPLEQKFQPPRPLLSQTQPSSVPNTASPLTNTMKTIGNSSVVAPVKSSVAAVVTEPSKIVSVCASVGNKAQPGQPKTISFTSDGKLVMSAAAVKNVIGLAKTAPSISTQQVGQRLQLNATLNKGPQTVKPVVVSSRQPLGGQVVGNPPYAGDDDYSEEDDDDIDAEGLQPDFFTASMKSQFSSVGTPKLSGPTNRVLSAAHPVQSPGLTVVKQSFSPKVDQKPNIINVRGKVPTSATPVTKLTGGYSDDFDFGQDIKPFDSKRDYGIKEIVKTVPDVGTVEDPRKIFETLERGIMDISDDVRKGGSYEGQWGASGSAAVVSSDVSSQGATPKRPHIYYCKLCAFKHTMQTAIEKHVRWTHATHLKPFQCDRCEFVGQTESSIASHGQNKHRNLVVTPIIDQSVKDELQAFIVESYSVGVAPKRAPAKAAIDADFVVSAPTQKRDKDDAMEDLFADDHPFGSEDTPGVTGSRHSGRKRVAAFSRYGDDFITYEEGLTAISARKRNRHSSGSDKTPQQLEPMGKTKIISITDRTRFGRDQFPNALYSCKICDYRIFQKGHKYQILKHMRHHSKLYSFSCKYCEFQHHDEYCMQQHAKQHEESAPMKDCYTFDGAIEDAIIQYCKDNMVEIKK